MITTGTFMPELRSRNNPDVYYYKVKFDIQDMSAVSFSPTSATFSLKGNDVCNTTRFTVD